MATPHSFCQAVLPDCWGGAERVRLCFARSIVEMCQSNSDRTTALVPSSAAEWPVYRPLAEPPLDRVIVHVFEFLNRLLAQPYIEVVLFRRPELMVAVLVRYVLYYRISGSLEVLDQRYARLPLPLLLEDRQHSLFGKPNEDVNVFGHNHESKTQPAIVASSRFEFRNYNPFAAVLIEQFPPAAASERDEVRVPFVIENSTSRSSFIR